MLETMIKQAIKDDRKNIKDDLHLLAWLWTTQEVKAVKSHEWCEKMGKIYTFLLKHFNPESVVREKRCYLTNHPELLPFAESTENLKREILNHEQELPLSPQPAESPACWTLEPTPLAFETGKKYIAEMRAMLETKEKQAETSAIYDEIEAEAKKEMRNW